MLLRTHNKKIKIGIRKKLRKCATPQETILWSRLKKEQLGFKFRRQHSIGDYIADFYCPKNKIIIEIDGWQHRENREYDLKRTHFFESLGFRVLRFWNGEINKNIEGVILKILNNLE